MRKIIVLISIITSIFFINVSFKKNTKVEKIQPNSYSELYLNEIENYSNKLKEYSSNEISKDEIHLLRIELKKIDFWLRYFEPIAYKKLNGPLPVEWETEVFEKYEKPYKRIGAGLTLAENAIDENSNPDSLINESINTIPKYQIDSIQQLLTSFHHFYFCNRLYLLNLATIYSTGFECPDTNRIIPELKSMIKHSKKIYMTFDESFPSYELPSKYWNKYESMIEFIEQSSDKFSDFDHYTFIKNYVNPLFEINQSCIQKFGLTSKNMLDYSLNNNATTIFSKQLYRAQSSKGIYSRINDPELLNQIKELGKLLFYDPILSGNNERSCASCHNPTTGFTKPIDKDLKFDKIHQLDRNTPSLLNSNFQQLIMHDGKHQNLNQQAKDVITNHLEMNGKEDEILKKILSCKEYKKTLKIIANKTPGYTKITFEHITSAIVFYYTSFSNYQSPFDDAMNNKIDVSLNVQKGFNLFMGKTACATCHFIPQFNGAKPPYTGSEFEVLGVPETNKYEKLDNDKGRGIINPVSEMLHAFRTNTIRNSSITGPYMHNGCFNTLEEVIDFYNEGGGNGKGFTIDNQTLSSEKLNLKNSEIEDLIAFIKSLDENVPKITIPTYLPKSSNSKLNNRIIGGTY
jgi:cytochrome c peroxidase